MPREFERILRFWLDRGVDGFRIDVAHALYKDPELRDEAEPVPGAEPRSCDRRASVDRAEVHGLYRRWRSLAGDRVLIGEVFLTDPERVAAYVRPDELHLAFNFTLLWEPWDAGAMRAAIDATLAALAPVGATSTRVLENHDVVRLRTRYGSLRRARAPALLLLALPGTVFLHAGQELGLEEVDLPAELRQDPVFLRTGGARRGRDGCRVPLPWSDGAPGFGFTSGTPWLPIPPAWASLAVAEQEADGGSTLALYRRAITLRRELGDGFSWRESRAGTLAFERGDVVCVVNTDGASLDLPDGDVLLATEDAAWVRV